MRTGLSGCAADSSAATPYKESHYKFNNLPTGDYAVKFEDGDSVKISFHIAYPTNRSDDHTRDIDGIAQYSNDRSSLINTQISGIVMKPVSELIHCTN